MFFRVTHSSSYGYLQIVESFREQGTVRQRVLSTLGCLDALQASGHRAGADAPGRLERHHGDGDGRRGQRGAFPLAHHRDGLCREHADGMEERGEEQRGKGLGRGSVARGGHSRSHHPAFACRPRRGLGAGRTRAAQAGASGSGGHSRQCRHLHRAGKPNALVRSRCAWRITRGLNIPAVALPTSI